MNRSLSSLCIRISFLSILLLFFSHLNVQAQCSPTVSISSVQGTTVCAGTTVNFTTLLNADASATSPTYQWQLNGFDIGGATSSTYNTNSLANNDQITVIIKPTTDPNSCGYTIGTTSFTSNVITMTINPVPSVTNSTTASTCSGTSPNIALTASVSSTFAWTLGTNTGGITGASASSGPSINQTLTNPSNSTAGSIVYSVTPTSTVGSCAGSATDITVTVNPAPAITTGTTASTCSGSGPNISLAATAASNFAWTLGINTGSITGASAASGSTINQTLTNPSNSSAGSIVYHVTPTSTPYGCVGTATDITVTVNPTPVVTTSTTATDCSNSAINISLTASASSTFAWSLGTNTGGITGASAASGSTINQTLTNPSSVNPGSIVYAVTPTSLNSCVGPVTNITVTVYPLPVLTSSASLTAQCSDLTLSYNPTSSTIFTTTTYAWTRATVTNITPVGPTSGSGNPNEFLINTTDNTPELVTYVYTLTAYGCTNPSTFNVSVTINPRPNQPATWVKQFPTAIYWDSACQGQQGVYYNVPTNPDAVSYAWSYTGSGVSNISGSTNTVSANFSTSASSGTLNVYAINTYSCFSLLPRSKSITVLPYNIWIGYISNDWSDTANWLLPVIPNQTISGQVPAAFYPAHITSGVQYINNFIDNLGVVTTIYAGSNLKVVGNMAINGTILGPGYLTMAGSSAQTFYGASNKIDNLELNNINGLTISPAFGNTLYVANNYLPTAGVLTTNNAFVLYSDAISTGTISQGSGSYISGNVICEKYIHAGGLCEVVTNCGRAYRFLGHPFSSSIALSQISDDMDITGNGGPANGFTYTQTNNPSSFWYDPTSPLANGSPINDPGWTAFTSTNGSGSNAWNQYQGIRAFVRGTPGQGLWPQVYIPGAVTLDMSGPINMGNQNMSLIHNNVSSYNFLSNPYPSNVDMSLTTRGSSIGANFWVWDPNQGTEGAYVSQPFNVSYILPAYSAFVATTSAASNNTILFQESNKVSSSASGNLFKATSGFGNNTLQLRVLTNNDSLSWDRLLLMFDANASAQMDESDAVKLYNPELSFYSNSTDNNQLSIDVRPYVVGQVIPLGFKTSIPQSYSIRVDDYNIPAGSTVYLQDNYLNQVQPLLQGLHYNFIVTSDPLSQGDSRFQLNVGSPTSIGNVNADNVVKVTVVPNPATKQVSISFETPGKENTGINITNMLGQNVYNRSLGTVQNGKIIVPVEEFPSGIYIVNITCGKNSVIRRLVKE